MSGEDREVIYRAILSREDGVRSRNATAPVLEFPDPSEQVIPRVHSEIQAALVDLGTKMDCNIWIPRSDRIAVAKASPDMPTAGLLATLPQIFGGHAEDTVRNIDVIWFKGPLGVAAFEVENTTATYSGLLRMADLLSLVPNIAFPLYIVADKSRRGDVRREILRPAFQNSRVPLERACAFLSYRAIRDIRSRYSDAQLRRLEPRFIDIEAEYFSRTD